VAAIISPGIFRFYRVRTRAQHAALVVGSMFARCPHRNTNFPSVYEQGCLDCGRVRFLGASFGPWRRRGVR
jgi:hypothetical protein